MAKNFYLVHPTATAEMVSSVDRKTCPGRLILILFIPQRLESLQLEFCVVLSQSLYLSLLYAPVFHWTVADLPLFVKLEFAPEIFYPIKWI